MYTQVALVSRQPRELSLRELFSSWPLGGRGGGKGLDGRLLDLAQLQINIGNVKKKNRKKFCYCLLQCCSDDVLIQAQA